MQKQKINCNFKSSYSLHLFGNVYTCMVENQTTIEDAVLEFIGTHENGKSNLDVTALVFFDECTITKIPQGLVKSFPNLKALEIYKSKLKHVERKDLKDLYQLEHLSFELNEITFLPDDLLADMKQLEYLNFYNNKIIIIEPNILDGLNKIKYVNFSSNPCINMVFDSKDICGNATLEEIKQAIRQKYLNQTSAKLKLKNEISSDINRVIQNENLKDFTVKVEGEEFKVHKFLLAARSSVFSEMIENNIDVVSLNIDSISTKNFREVLNFIYTDELPTSDNIDFTHLFMAADKLKIHKLKDFCAEKLIKKINAENTFEMITLANKYDHEGLREKSFEQIKKILGYDDIDEELAKQTDLIKEALDYKNKLNAILKKN